MNKEIEERLEILDEQRAKVLHMLCTDPELFHPEVILSLVHKARSITEVIRILRKDNEKKQTRNQS